MKHGRVMCLLILLTMVVSCNRHQSIQQAPILGRYELSAHDNSGRLVFKGTLSLTSLEQNHLKGQREIRAEKNAPDALFDVNGASCEGLIDGKKVDIDFAPFLDDAGLLLEGQFDNDRITGIWRMDGFITSDPLGTFEAVK